MITKLRQQLRAGKLYEGAACYSDDYSLVPRPGYYALSADGKTVLPKVPLVCVDDAPGDHEDGACHYEYAGPKDYPQRSGGKPLGRGGTISMEAHADGTSETNA